MSYEFYPEPSHSLFPQPHGHPGPIGGAPGPGGFAFESEQPPAGVIGQALWGPNPSSGPPPPPGPPSPGYPTYNTSPPPSQPSYPEPQSSYYIPPEPDYFAGGIAPQLFSSGSGSYLSPPAPGFPGSYPPSFNSSPSSFPPPSPSPPSPLGPLTGSPQPVEASIAPAPEQYYHHQPQHSHSDPHHRRHPNPIPEESCVDEFEPDSLANPFDAPPRPPRHDSGTLVPPHGTHANANEGHSPYPPHAYEPPSLHTLNLNDNAGKRTHIPEKPASPRNSTGFDVPRSPADSHFHHHHQGAQGVNRVSSVSSTATGSSFTRPLSISKNTNPRLDARGSMPNGRTPSPQPPPVPEHDYGPSTGHGTIHRPEEGDAGVHRMTSNASTHSHASVHRTTSSASSHSQASVHHAPSKTSPLNEDASTNVQRNSSTTSTTPSIKNNRYNSSSGATLRPSPSNASTASTSSSRIRTTSTHRPTPIDSAKSNSHAPIHTNGSGTDVPPLTPPKDESKPFSPVVLYAYSSDLTRGFPTKVPTFPPKSSPLGAGAGAMSRSTSHSSASGAISRVNSSASSYSSHSHYGEKEHGGEEQHPFEKHNVKNEDWFAFLDDLRLAMGQGDAAGKLVADVAGQVGLARIASFGIDAYRKSKRASPIGQTIDQWNQIFFHPRSMEVMLAQGRIRYTGPEGHPPDVDLSSDTNASGAQILYDHEESDDEDDDGAGGKGKGDGILGGFLKGSRGHSFKRKARKEKREDYRLAADEKWRLVVAYKPALIL